MALLGKAQFKFNIGWQSVFSSNEPIEYQRPVCKSPWDSSTLARQPLFLIAFRVGRLILSQAINYFHFRLMSAIYFKN